MTEHEEDYLREKLRYVAAQDGVRNASRYLTAAIRNDFRAEPDAAPRAMPAATQERARRLAILQSLVAARTPTQRDADKRTFLARLDAADRRADFEQHGWMSALNAQAIFAFWDEIQPGAFDGVGES